MKQLMYTREIRTTDGRGTDMHVTVFVTKQFAFERGERLYVCRETGSRAASLTELKKIVATI